MESNKNKKLGELCSFIFDDVEKDILEEVGRGDLKEEDSITSNIFALLKERVNKNDIEGLNLRAREFAGRGSGSEESIIGADGALVLNVQLENVGFTKFCLLQAKKFKDKKLFLIIGQ